MVFKFMIGNIEARQDEIEDRVQKVRDPMLRSVKMKIKIFWSIC